MRSQPLAAWIITLFVLLIAGCSQATATEISSGEEEAAACKEMIFSHSFVSSRGFESNIVAICPDGTYPRQVTTDGLLYNSMPYWSPDGSQIAFLSARSGTQQLYIMDRDGGNVRQLTSVSDLYGGGLIWLPYGNRIAIVLPKDGGLYWQAVDVVSRLRRVHPRESQRFKSRSATSSRRVRSLDKPARRETQTAFTCTLKCVNAMPMGDVLFRTQAV